MTKQQRVLVSGLVTALFIWVQPAAAAVDLNGSWYIRIQVGTYTEVFPSLVTQTGSALSWNLNAVVFSGSVDVDTGAFTVTGEPCVGTVDTLTGTAALDSSTFSANGIMHFPLFATSCPAINTTVTGVRGLCGDGTVAADGEDCDDGNTFSGDCCSSTCQYELSGSLCSDGNASTCDACDGAGTCQGATCPTFDLSGPWVFPFYGSTCLQFVQNGISLTATHCNSGGPTFIGTVDAVTRHFHITQPPEDCVVGISGDYCDLDATAAPDLMSWTGTYDCRVSDITPPSGCYSFVETTTAVRGYCGDGFVIASSGEQCDDGASSDCCSPACQYEQPGTSCDYGSGCGVCIGAGICDPVACPSALDHYKCYDGKDLKSPPFARQTVGTADQLTNEQVTVHRLKYACAPVNKNGEGINDPSAHLACYQVSAALLAPRPQVEVSSQFQMSRFELKRPRLMCLPATKVVLP